MLTEGDCPDKAWPKVAMMMIMSSIPSSLSMLGDDEMATCIDVESGLTHLLTTNDISEPTKEELATESSNGGCYLYTEILIGIEFATDTIDVTQHDRCDVDRKDIVAGIGG